MAANGALVGGRCFTSQEAAADAYYGSAAPSQTPGGTGYLSTFEKVAGVWKVKRYQVADTGVTLTAELVAPTVSFPACDPFENFKDGMTAGWGVAAAMAVAWSVMVLRRGI